MMLQRRLLWMFAVLITVIVAIGLFSLQATTSTSRDFDYLVDHTASTLHALSHLKAATARLTLEAERLTAQGNNAPTDAFERAQVSFEEALAEYEIVASLDDNGAHLAEHIGSIGNALLSQAAALREPGKGQAQLDAALIVFQNSEQQLSSYLEEAISLESSELEQGDASADRAARSRVLVAVLATGGALILALTFGALLIRQAGIEGEVQARLQVAKRNLEKEVAASTTSLEQASRALQAQLEQKVQTEEALAQSEERFRVAAEEALVGIYIIQDDKLSYVNPAMARFFGYEPEELINTVSPLELIAADDRQGVAQRMQERLAGIRADAPYCFRGLRRDGGELIVESIGRKIQLQGRPAIIGTMLDITERQQAAQEITRRNQELQALLTVSQRLAGEFSFEERLQTITDTIVETIAAADAASLWLYDDRREQLVVHAWSGYKEEEIASLSAARAKALACLVSGAGQPAVGDQDEIRGEDAQRSVLGVPILREGDLLGGLFASSSSPQYAFDRHDLRFLQAVADEATIAIKNAELLETGERQLKELHQLSQQLLVAREVEARRISQELHDVMGQALTAVSIDLAKLKQELRADAAATLQERVEEAESLILQTLGEMRELSHELRPTMLDDLGLLPTLRWYVRQFGRRLDIAATFESAGLRERPPSEVETALYRVVQEGLTNVARHAQAQEVCVYLHCDGRTLTLALVDDGIGFDARASLMAASAGQAMGLLGMRERVAAVGGRLRLESAPARGTRLTVTMRCPPPACSEKRIETTHE